MQDNPGLAEDNANKALQRIVVSAKNLIVSSSTGSIGAREFVGALAHTTSQ